MHKQSTLAPMIIQGQPPTKKMKDQLNQLNIEYKKKIKMQFQKPGVSQGKNQKLHNYVEIKMKSGLKRRAYREEDWNSLPLDRCWFFKTQPC